VLVMRWARGPDVEGQRAQEGSPRVAVLIMLYIRRLYVMTRRSVAGRKWGKGWEFNADGPDKQGQGAGCTAARWHGQKGQGEHP
jgi:hypothetical protein